MARKEPGVRLWVEIKLEGDGFPSAEELGGRNEIMRQVEEKEIGRLGGSGGGLGVMDFEVEVEDAKVRSARARISRLIRRILPGWDFTIRRMGDS